MSTEGSLLGPMLIRMLSDDLSPKEMREILGHLVKDEALRSKCTAIGHMAASQNREDRQRYARSLVTLLMHKVNPPEDSDMRHMHMNADFASAFKRVPFEVPWHGHLVREAGAQQTWVSTKEGYLVTAALWCIVRAIEDLWDVRGLYTVGAKGPTPRGISKTEDP